MRDLDRLQKSGLRQVITKEMFDHIKNRDKEAQLEELPAEKEVMDVPTESRGNDNLAAIDLDAGGRFIAMFVKHL